MSRKPTQKDIVFRSEQLRRAVASLECMHCGLEGSTQASHSNQSRDGRGIGHKTSDAFLAALCFKCHHEVDYSHTLNREEKLDVWENAYRRTIRALLERGLLIVDRSKI